MSIKEAIRNIEWLSNPNDDFLDYSKQIVDDYFVIEDPYNNRSNSVPYILNHRPQIQVSKNSTTNQNSLKGYLPQKNDPIGSILTNTIVVSNTASPVKTEYQRKEIDLAIDKKTNLRSIISQVLPIQIANDYLDIWEVKDLRKKGETNIQAEPFADPIEAKVNVNSYDNKREIKQYDYLFENRAENIFRFKPKGNRDIKGNILKNFKGTIESERSFQIEYKTRFY